MGINVNMEQRLDQLLQMEEVAVYSNGYRPDASAWSLTPEAIQAVDKHDAANASWIRSDAVLWEQYGKPYVSYLQLIDLGNRVGVIEHHAGISRMFDYSTNCMRELAPYELTSDKRTDVQLRQFVKIFSRPTLGNTFALFPHLAKIAESELTIRACKAVQKSDVDAYSAAKRTLTPERLRSHKDWRSAVAPIIISALHAASRPHF